MGVTKRLLKVAARGAGGRTAERSRALAAGGVIAFAALQVVTGAADATPPGANGNVAYVGPGLELHCVTAGSQPTNLHHAGISPAWSPDGAQIAFLAVRTGGYALRIINADGSGGRDVASAGGMPLAWSADATKIAFTRDQRVRVVNLADGVETDLGNGIDPAWSPDGTEIAFSSNRSGDYELYVMDADGSDVRRLTNSTGPDWQPTWAPDGTQLAFVSTRGGDQGRIWRVAATGGAPVFVAGPPPDHGGDLATPRWSPDGTTIAYAAGAQILTVPVMGGTPSELTRSSANQGLDWQATSGTAGVCGGAPGESPDNSPLALIGPPDDALLTAPPSLSWRVGAKDHAVTAFVWQPDSGRQDPTARSEATSTPNEPVEIGWLPAVARPGRYFWRTEGFRRYRPTYWGDYAQNDVVSETRQFVYVPPLALAVRTVRPGLSLVTATGPYLTARLSIARGGEQERTAELAFSPEDDSGVGELRYEWSCKAAGGHTVTATPLDFPEAAAAERAMSFETPGCARRYGGSVRTGATAGEQLTLSLTDEWLRDERYRVCWRGPRRSDCEAGATYRGRSRFRTKHRTVPGKYEIKWYVGGELVDTARLRVRPPARPEPAIQYCRAGLCAVAIRATLPVARLYYREDQNATGYNARCARESRVRYSCDAIVSGVVSDRLVGGGERYRCFYPVSVRIYARKTRVRRLGGVYSDSPYATCVT